MLRKVAAVASLACLLPSLAVALPDLTPQNGIYDVTLDTNAVPQGDVDDGCAAATTGRILVRFGVRTTNVGPDPLVLGELGCPGDCSTNSGLMCANPDFECSLSGTPRAVFISSARYELLDMAGNVVAVGAKRNYCFNDDVCTPPATPTFTDCQHDQGLSSQCADDYEPFLGCQYIDATDVPGITTRAFRLRVTIDPNAVLPDADRSNNVTEVVLPGCGDGVVQPGEECDPGPTAGATCCDSRCHLVGAGTSCRAAAGPCDVAAVCDGTSDSCPANRPAPDGVVCGPGVPPCITEECSAGACVDRADPASGCLIDGTCVAAGAVDPQDACRRCDVDASADAWSRNQDANPGGIRCELAYITTLVQGIACPSRTATALAHRLRVADRMAARLETARPRTASVLRQRLERVARRVGRLLAGSHSSTCQSNATASELGVLEQQLAAMQ